MMVSRNFIAGAWVEGRNVLRKISPSDASDVIGEFASGSAADAAAAVESASAALPKLARLTIQQRAERLDLISDEIYRRRDELGYLLSREEGKILADGVGEAVRAAQVFRYFAGEALRLSGERIGSLRANIDVDVTHEPLGVIAAITPWNFPLAVPAWKTAAALAFGNAVVLKPSEVTPACAYALAEIVGRAGFPEGAFNLVMGDGAVGAALAKSPRIQGVSFTGSTRIGQLVAQDAIANGTKLQLELGGKNPLIVLDDADLDLAVDGAVNAAFYQTGQRCTAASRLIVAEAVHDSFVEKIESRIAQLKIGHALDPATQIGPVIDERQFEKNMEYIGIGRAEGAELRCGGERLNQPTQGYFQRPALFAGTRNDMRINKEEIFGPIAAVIRVSGYEEALAVANDTPFGLSSAIFTRNASCARDFQRRTKSGMAMINLPTAGIDYHVPFGGAQKSGYGPRELGKSAWHFYTEPRTTYRLEQAI